MINKKNKAVILLIMTIIILAGLTACWKNPVRLDAPCNFVFENRIVSWDKVENAVKYAVLFEGKEYEVEDNKFNTLEITVEEKEYTIEVIAVGDEEDYIDSEWVTFNFAITAPIEYGYDDDGLLYKLLEDKRGYEVSRGWTDLEGVVNIPAYFNGLLVTKISDNAFFSTSSEASPDPFTENACNTQTTGVILPATLNSIGKNSFSCMVRLSEITIPDSVTSIGMNAFYGCSHLEKVVLPKNLKVIPSECFSDCALKEVLLPDGLEEIDGRAFLCNTRTGDDSPRLLIKHTEQNFTEIVIPDSVKAIGNGVFKGCKMLKDITLSKNIETLGIGVFADTAWYDAQPDGIVVIGDVLYDYKGDIEGGTLVVPNGIRIIASGALELRDDLKRVIFSESVTTISNRAFSFSGFCEIIFPSGLKVIEKAAFSACSNLKWVVLPKSLESIDEKSFYKSNALTSVYYTGNLGEWEALLSRNDVEKSVLYPYATVYYYSETKPSSEGDYWHYIDGEVTKW